MYRLSIEQMKERIEAMKWLDSRLTVRSTHENNCIKSEWRQEWCAKHYLVTIQIDCSQEKNSPGMFIQVRRADGLKTAPDDVLTLMEFAKNQILANLVLPKEVEKSCDDMK